MWKTPGIGSSLATMVWKALRARLGSQHFHIRDVVNCCNLGWCLSANTEILPLQTLSYSVAVVQLPQSTSTSTSHYPVYLEPGSEEERIVFRELTAYEEHNNVSEKKSWTNVPVVGWSFWGILFLQSQNVNHLHLHNIIYRGFSEDYNSFG